MKQIIIDGHVSIIAESKRFYIIFNFNCNLFQLRVSYQQHIKTTVHLTLYTTINKTL